MKTSTVIFDVETGGTKDEHPIIQIAAIAVRGDELVGSFERKLDFRPALCDPEALKMNSYDGAAWDQHAVTPRHAAGAFADFCRSHADLEMKSKRGNAYKVCRLMGFNCVSFDIPRTRKLMEQNGRQWWPACWWYPLDVYQRAVWHFFETAETPPENYQLGTLLAHFGVVVEGEAHDASTDCVATWELAKQLRTRCPF